MGRIFTLILFFKAVSPSYACLNGSSHVLTLSERTIEADIVLEGRIWHEDFLTMVRTNGVDSKGKGGFVFYIIVERYLKGNGPSIVRISGLNGTCMSWVKNGDRLIFFTKGDGENNIFYASNTGNYSLTVEPTRENLDEIIDSSGQVPVSKTLSQKDETQIFLYEIRWLIRVVLLIIVILFFWWVWRRVNGRNYCKGPQIRTS